jgi:hypothetical protein
MIRPTRSKPTEDKKEYPDFITSEERDKVINALLKGTVNSESVILEYEDIPELKMHLIIKLILSKIKLQEVMMKYLRYNELIRLQEFLQLL